MTEEDDGPGWTTSALAGLIALLLPVQNLEQALQHLAEVAVAAIPDGPGCGITVVRDGRPVTAVYAGAIPKTAHDHGFPAAAMAGGARGLHAHPLTIGGAVAGALGLYAHEPGLFPPPVQRIAAQFAETAALLLDGVIRRVSQDHQQMGRHA